jgi:hypothetical protein
MKNVNAMLLDSARTSIFIAHRLRTVVEAGENSRGMLPRVGDALTLDRCDYSAQGGYSGRARYS